MNLHHGHVLDILPTLDAGSVQCCVTSPPYWGLRDYGTGGVDWPDGWHGELGLEPTPELYVEHLVAVFRAVRRVLRNDGTLWLNLGDSYAGSGKGAWDRTDAQKEVYVPKPGGPEASMPKVPPGLKPKDLVGIPWRVAFALQADGWWLRSDIIWSKPNPMPESVRDRPTRAHEYIFLLSKSARYYYDADAIAEDGVIPAGTLAAKGSAARAAEPGVNARPAEYKEYTGKRNKRSVWSITTAPFPEAHFATFPPKLPELCIKAGSAEQSCPECGAPWERVVEREHVGDNTSKRPDNPRAGIRGSGLARPPQTVAQKTMLGWRPTCKCGRADTVGSVVLDPFIGSGTVGLVAEKLGRRWVGIDANAEYLEIAKRRLAQPTLWTPEDER